MTDITDPCTGDYTNHAHTAILAAVHDQQDFGGWLAGVLASVAATSATAAH